MALTEGVMAPGAVEDKIGAVAPPAKEYRAAAFFLFHQNALLPGPKPWFQSPMDVENEGWLR